MGYLDGFGVIIKKWFGVRSDTGARVTLEYPEEVRPKPERFHGRHVLNRYEDGMEKCIGCELCAAVCPANCIYVRGEDNDPDDPTSPGERFGFVYEINYLRCIHCDLCVESCPTEAITETKLFEFSFTNRDDAIYTKKELLVGDDGRPKQLPWENWDGGFDPAQDTSGWMRATSPGGDHKFNNLIAWAGELGYGVRPPERATILEETGPVPAVAEGHHDSDEDLIAYEADSWADEGPDHESDRRDEHELDDGAVVDLVEPQVIVVPVLDQAVLFDSGDVNPDAAATYEVAAQYDAEGLSSDSLDFDSAVHFDAPPEPKGRPFDPDAGIGSDLPAFEDALHFDAPEAPPTDETPDAVILGTTTQDLFGEQVEAKTFDAVPLDEKTVRRSDLIDEIVGEPDADLVASDDEEPPFPEPDPSDPSLADPSDQAVAGSETAEPGAAESESGVPSDHADWAGAPAPEEPEETVRPAGHFDAPDLDEPEKKKKRRFGR